VDLLLIEEKGVTGQKWGKERTALKGEMGGHLVGQEK